MQAEGIAREHTARGTPPQNGVAERRNRTLAEGVTSMRSEAKLPLSFWAFWGEALQTFNYVLNMSPTSSLSGPVTPYELWHGPQAQLFATQGVWMQSLCPYSG